MQESMADPVADSHERVASFAAAHGWPGAAVAPLAADASFRRYFRICLAGRTAVVMDAPPAKEDIRPFVRLARHLVAMGYSAPRVLAADEAVGLALLDDLGDATFTRLLASGADEGALYTLATDLLIDLHRRPAAEAVPAGLPPYDDRRLVDEAALLPDWFLPAVGTAVAAAAREAYLASWRAVLPEARRVKATLVLRDFHVDNLMRVEGRKGIGACGLLDFQDAVAGPVTYDLVSLLEDARRDVPEALAAAMIARYRAAFPALDSAAFEASYAILGAQRHAKVIGIFTRLCVRDGKPGYLAHIPRVWRMLERALVHPALAPVAAWFDRHVPAAARRAPVRPAA
jgi:aminoglycoside/choline kinase family phosphotransferase